MLKIEFNKIFETLYYEVEKAHPEIEKAEILVAFENHKNGVMLLVGTEEDTNRYKISINPSYDEEIIARFFITGLALLIYRFKYNKYIHPLATDEDYQTDEHYDRIIAEIYAIHEKLKNTGAYLE